MSLGKQLSTLMIAAVLLGLGARVATHSDLPFWGYWEPIKLVAPPIIIADDAMAKPDSAFAKSTSAYEVNLAATMVLHMKRNKSNIHFVDAREDTLYKAGHIPGAINVAFDHIDKDSEKFLALPKDDLIVIYCDGGDCHLSHDLAEFALAQGYSRLAVFTGGWEEWSKETDMIETGGGEN